MLTSKLGIGPMSSEIIEAVFRYSHTHDTTLMLIASKNQIDYNGGYVNKWNTKKYSHFLSEMKKKYPQSKVAICRDHCGPGFNKSYELEDTYKTIEEDIKNNFDLIHIDFCHFPGKKEDALKESKKAIEYCLSLNPKILLEIGTDDNVGMHFNVSEIKRLGRDIGFFTKFCAPEFYVVQTGSLVKEINQVGDFNKSFVEKVSLFLRSNGLKLKEHNADYLSKEDIMMRKGIVDAMNIAPQLGAVQTMEVLQKCLMYGISFEKFTNEVYQGERWRKWLSANTADNKFLCSVIAGHYHFSTDPYQTIIKLLKKRELIQNIIIQRIMEVIDHYASDK